MEVKATLKHLRISPRKVRLVIDVVRGMSVQQAEEQLMFMNKQTAKHVLKLIQSATANAKNNFKLEKKDLFIKEIVADEGFTLKRWMPRAHGRATPLRKRSSHIRLVLASKAKPKTKKKVETKKVETKDKPEVKKVKKATKKK